MKKAVSVIIMVVLLMTAIAPAFAEHTHRWMTEGYQAATCTRDGYSRRRCITCGASDYTKIWHTGHKFDGKWTTVTIANFEHAGSRKHQCTKCKQWFSETIPQKTYTNKQAEIVRDRYGDVVLGYGYKADKEDIKKLQQDLYDLGYYKEKIDGEFEGKTEAAVKAFQKARGYKVDGKVGILTKLELVYGAN